MTITVTKIIDGPFDATGLKQTAGYGFMTLTNEELRVWYDLDGGRAYIDPSLYKVTRNRDGGGYPAEGGSVEISAGAIPVDATFYIMAAPLWTRDIVWSNAGSQLYNLNEEQDRITLRQLVVEYETAQIFGSANDILLAAAQAAVDAQRASDAAGLAVETVDAFAGYLDRNKNNLIEWMPTHLRPAIMAGTNTTDLVPYINAAIASGRELDPSGYTYLIGSRVILKQNSRLKGYGIFKAMTSFSDGAGGLNMLLQPASGSEVSQGIIFDGSELTTANIYGCRNVGPLNNFRCGATFKNVSFVGIDINRNFGYWTNTDIVISSHVENTGWSGIEVSATRLRLENTSVYRTGFNAYMLTDCEDIVATGFRADKSVPPFHIYDGAGSYGGAEEGFLFGHFNCRNGRFSDFFLYDNRNAGSDGWGLGEDGSGGFDESIDLVVTNGIVDRAGLFGFDCTGRMTVRNVIIKRAARQGLMIGLDLGGTISDLDVEVSIFDSGQSDTTCGAVMFLATGPAPRTISTTSGSPVVTITGGSGFHVVAGQKVTGAGIPAGTTVASVSGASVTLSANATATATGVAATFRGVINYRNVRVNAKVNGAPWGVVFESGENGYATYDNVEVSGDFSQNITNSSVRVVNGVTPAGVRIAPETRLKVHAEELTGGAFSAFGRRAVALTGSQLDYVINGYDGQELEMYAGSDITINFDWTNAGGWGTNRLIGNGNVDLAIKAGDLIHMVYRANVGWYCNHVDAY